MSEHGSKEWVVPWRCLGCNRAGEVRIPVSGWGSKKARLGAVFAETAGQHSVGEVPWFELTCGLLDWRWEWPEGWEGE
jgi:hypothetical protein